jgi:SAM-dependent methyltransferase
MLHHVPSVALQDRLVAEAFRVLRPGGIFAGLDTTVSLVFRATHLFDAMVLVDSGQCGSRLERAGFERISVQPAKGAFKFEGRKP